MIRIAIRSSTTAIVDSSSFIPVGTRDPSSESTPSANAMWVAAGTDQRRIAVGSSWLRALNSKAGTTTPAAAQTTGSASRSNPASWPVSDSRLISSETSRKNTAISPSLIHSSHGLAIRNSPNTTATGMSRKPSYSEASGELAHTSASAAATISRMPLADSSLRKSDSACSARVGSGGGTEAIVPVYRGAPEDAALRTALDIVHLRRETGAPLGDLALGVGLEHQHAVRTRVADPQVLAVDVRVRARLDAARVQRPDPLGTHPATAAAGRDRLVVADVVADEPAAVEHEGEVAGCGPDGHEVVAGIAGIAGRRLQSAIQRRARLVLGHAETHARVAVEACRARIRDGCGCRRDRFGRLVDDGLVARSLVDRGSSGRRRSGGRRFRRRLAAAREQERQGQQDRVAHRRGSRELVPEASRRR